MICYSRKLPDLSASSVIGTRIVMTVTIQNVPLDCTESNCFVQCARAQRVLHPVACKILSPTIVSPTSSVTGNELDFPCQQAFPESLCCCSALEFQAYAPLAIKEGTDVHLNCAGRQVKSFTEKGNGVATIESNANFTLENCNWDSFNDATAPVEANAGLPGVRLAQDAHVLIINSFARMECIDQVRSH